MLDLVTVEEACIHLRTDYEVDSFGVVEGPDVPWLNMMIPAISEAVALWLKDSWRLYVPELDSDGQPVVDSDGDWVPVLDSDGNPVVRHVVKAAVLVELASQYRFREGEGKDNTVPPDAGWGYVLNKASTALLAGIRRSTVA